MAERRSGNPEAELLLTAAIFAWRFQVAVHSHVNNMYAKGGEPVITKDNAPGHRISYGAKDQLVQLVFAHPEPGNHEKVPFEYTDIMDVGENPGRRIACISMSTFPTGHFELSAVAPAQTWVPDEKEGNRVLISLEDLSVKISSASLTHPDALRKQLSDDRLKRAFEHFGIPPQILTGAPTT